jgi:hypothetical protein
VLATGAGANGRISLGLSVLSGIIASTCLAVLFVPSFFSVLQGFAEWRKARKKTPIAAAALRSDKGSIARGSLFHLFFQVKIRRFGLPHRFVRADRSN